MRLEPSAFRHHIEVMIKENNLKQAAMWAENGTLIYSNVNELHDIYDEEYRDQVER